MTAPLGQRIRCALSGHEWRRAIGPREGYYLRCRRCWITEQEEPQAHVHDAHAQAWQHAGLQRQA